MAAPWKAACRRGKDDLAVLLRAKAQAEGVKEHYKYAHEEILAVIQRGLRHLRELNSSRDLVLSAAARNGMLDWKPKGGVLVKAEEQDWRRKLPPTGNHRMEPEWYRDRCEGLEVLDALPPPVSFRGCRHAKTWDDLAEAE